MNWASAAEAAARTAGGAEHGRRCRLRRAPRRRAQRAAGRARPHHRRTAPSRLRGGRRAEATLCCVCAVRAEDPRLRAVRSPLLLRVVLSCAQRQAVPDLQAAVCL